MIKNLQPEDRGFYTCRAKNDAGTRLSLAAELRVFGLFNLILIIMLISQTKYCFYESSTVYKFIFLKKVFFIFGGRKLCLEKIRICNFPFNY